MHDHVPPSPARREREGVGDGGGSSEGSICGLILSTLKKKKGLAVLRVQALWRNSINVYVDE